VHAVKVLSEPLSIAFIAVFLAAAWRFAVDRKLSTLALATAGLVVTTYIRPASLAFVPLLLLLLPILHWPHPARLGRALLLVLAIAGLGLGPWIARNAQAGYATFSTVGDFGPIFHASGLEGAITGEDSHLILERYRSELRASLGPDSKFVDQRRWYRALRAKGIAVIRTHATAFPGYLARKVAKVAMHPDHHTLRQVTTGESSSDPLPGEEPLKSLGDFLRLHPAWTPVMGFELALTAGAWLLGAIGLYALWTRRADASARFQAALLFGVIAFGLLSGAFPNAQARYRLPVLPALFPLAALGANALRDRWARSAR
jgi:hypothetical protein